MDYKHIHILLESYWEGTSSVEDERQLKAFFSGDKVPETLKAFQAYFAYLDTAEQISLDKNLPHLDPVSPILRVKPPFYKQVTWQVIGVAASLICVFSIYFLLQSPKLSPEQRTQPIANLLPKDSFENPEEAYKIAKEALLIFSGKMKAGKTMIFKPKDPSIAEENEK